jgi:hypothetical protein
MVSQKRAAGPDRLGGAQPPSGGGYGDVDRSAQNVDESDAPDVKQQEPKQRDEPARPVENPDDEVDPD